jgi:KAP family P-loop domain
MPNPSRNESSPIKILTDDIEVRPILDFDAYSEMIVNIIRGSTPKFSIGIYGVNASGKSTLMKKIENKLKDSHILTSWFNSMWYETEEHFALIALIKTIADTMGEHQYYKGKNEAKSRLLKGIGIVGKDVLRNLALRYAMTQKGVDELEKIFVAKRDLLHEFNEKKIQTDFIRKIVDEMKKIRMAYPNTRLVVLIDNLDKCSPITMVEILNSISLFHESEGFVFICALNIEVVSEMLSPRYDYDRGFQGDWQQYMKRIINVPIVLPRWTSYDTKQLIELTLEKLDKKYSDFLLENVHLIEIAVEYNPREVKRFINNFIVTYELFHTFIKPDELLILQILRTRWIEFYLLISRSSEDIREEIRKYIYMHPDERNSEFEEIEESHSSEIKRELRDFKLDYPLWDFLKDHYDYLLRLKNWEIYRRVVEIVE